MVLEGEAAGPSLAPGESAVFAHGLRADGPAGRSIHVKWSQEAVPVLISGKNLVPSL